MSQGRMSQGRGSANAIIGAVAVALLLCFIAQVAQAKIYVVGDDKGWTFDIVTWTDGKTFKAGDVLVFNYSPAAHNVVKVSSQSHYDACQDTSTPYTSGGDHITLEAGPNFFICSFKGHCEGGMKIAAFAN